MFTLNFKFKAEFPSSAKNNIQHWGKLLKDSEKQGIQSNNRNELTHELHMSVLRLCVCVVIKPMILFVYGEFWSCSCQLASSCTHIKIRPDIC